MSDGAISQDEIDALLAGVDMGGMGASSAAPSQSLSDAQVNALKGFLSGNLGALKSNLESMTAKSAEYGAPVIEVMNRDSFLRKIPEMVVASLVDFSETLVGDHLFVLSPEFAQKLVSLVNNEESAELDDMALSVIGETVSQHTGTEITSIEKAGLKGVVNTPAETVHVPKAMVRFPQGDFAVFTYPVTLDGAAFSLWEIIPYSMAQQIATAFGAPGKAAASEATAGMAAGASMGMGQSMGGGMGMQAMGGMPGMGGMNMGNMNMGGMGMQSMGGMPMQGQVMGMNPNVQPVQFPNLQLAPMGMEQGNIGLIMDVYMEMTVELGRTRKVIKEILGMGEGTIIELDKLAGEPVDILVNHKPIAKGEVVVIDENFGVRVTEILSPVERVSDM